MPPPSSDILIVMSWCCRNRSESGMYSQKYRRTRTHLGAFSNDHLDGREILAVGAVFLDNGPQRVLEHLKEDMVLHRHAKSQ